MTNFLQHKMISKALELQGLSRYREEIAKLIQQNSSQQIKLGTGVPYSCNIQFLHPGYKKEYDYVMAHGSDDEKNYLRFLSRFENNPVSIVAETLGESVAPSPDGNAPEKRNLHYESPEEFSNVEAAYLHLNKLLDRNPSVSKEKVYKEVQTYGDENFKQLIVSLQTAEADSSWVSAITIKVSLTEELKSRPQVHSICDMSEVTENKPGTLEISLLSKLRPFPPEERLKILDHLNRRQNHTQIKHAIYDVTNHQLTIDGNIIEAAL